MNMDDLFVEIGEFGLFQIRQYLLLALPILFSAYQTISFVFTTSVPEFRCFVPECEEEGSKDFWTPWLNSSIPFKNGKPKQCVRYKPFMGHTSNLSNFCDTNGFNEKEIMSCDSFIFSPNETTVTSEFEIVCPDNDWKIVLVVSITYVGFFIGMPFAGLISDRFGRRKAMVISWFIQSLVAIIQSFSTSYETFTVLQFLGAFTCGAYNAGFIMALEVLGPRMRVLGNALICSFHSIGQINVGITMWLARDWRIMNRFLFGPGLLSLAYFWLVPESVRWLISKGRVDDAIAVLRCIAEMNGRHLTLTFENNVRMLALANSCQGAPRLEMNEIGNAAAQIALARRDPPTGLRKLFNSHILLLRLFFSVICWGTISMLFYALSLKSVTLSGDKYLNFVLAVLVELPGYLATYILMDIVHFGRRTSLCLSLALTGLSCLIFFFLQAFQCFPVFQVIFFLSAKLSITFSFAVIYVFSAEMFPTEIRNSVLGICSMSGHIGSVFAPTSLLLIKRFDPIFIWGIVALVGAFFATRLPETRNSKLPETIKDAEDLE